MYDEEAIYQDADILQAQYEAESREHTRLRDEGWCSHSGLLGRGDGRGPLEGGAYYPEQVGLTGTQQLCTSGCGTVFASFEEARNADLIRFKSDHDEGLHDLASEPTCSTCGTEDEPEAALSEDYDDEDGDDNGMELDLS